MKEEDTKVADIFDKDIENFGKDLDKMIEHLNIVIATHNKQVEEIERLNKKIEQYENPEDMTLMFMWCDEKAKDEIKRLNNIINELERYINEEYIYDEVGMKIFDASTLQDKLQELKGSDK